MNKSNPFSITRAEYMKDLWKYYVPFQQLNADMDIPLVVNGGRGTGKTMFFLCNSWREKYKELKSEHKQPISELLNEAYIGIYYRVDTGFVSSMRGETHPDEKWEGIFNTYFSVMIIKELFAFFDEVNKEGNLNTNNVRSIAQSYFLNIRGIEKTTFDLTELMDDCKKVLIDIEDAINDPRVLDQKAFRLTAVGNAIKNVVSITQDIDCLKDVTFKIYIDEYENLSEWQQRLLNTLIKHSDSKIIYNIGVRPKGLKTEKTQSDSEQIQSMHDYKLFNFDDLLDDNQYIEDLRTICSKRLKLFKQASDINLGEISDNIDFYLGNYDINDELSTFEKSNNEPHYFKKLGSLIEQFADDKNQVDKYTSELCQNAPLLNSRMHLALLLRNKANRPKVEELYLGFCDWKNDNDSFKKKEYGEWLHNTSNGVVFLLAKEFNKRKLYYGFNTFVALSSGITRYFLALCEQTFSFAIMDSFTWEKPSQIEIDVQTRAAQYISRYQIMEIDTYKDYGKKISLMTKVIGNIFKEFHRNENSTLGEPEYNHFHADMSVLTEEERRILNSAVFWAVLHELPSSKDKDIIDANSVDFHLNKIYTPYFEISYNRKRKLNITQALMKALLSGDKNEAEREARKFIKNRIYKNLQKDEGQLTMFDDEE